jgi:hypothetical protein
MMEEREEYQAGNALEPVEQKTVYFYDDEVTAVRLDDGIVYVPVRPICELLGVAWNAQFERMKRDPVLSTLVTTVRVTRTEGAREVARELQALPLDFLSGWLFGINANRVKEEEVRERLIRYQKECYKVLAAAFVSPAAAPASGLEQVRQMALAIAKMAEEQMEFDSRLGTAETRLTQVGDRLDILEAKLGPGEAVTDEQASQISQAVKAVAFAMGGKGQHYQGVYGEMYRKFGVTGYKKIRASAFDDVMVWLTEWYTSLTDDDVPF